MATDVIAVVDGRKTVHDFVVQTLTAAEYTVRGYLSRATFLVDAPTLQPSIILLGADDDAFDVDTPIVMETIRLAAYRPQLPVILYSANPDAKAREKVEDASDVLPLPTPFTAERLLQAVRDVSQGTATCTAVT
jgi:FixJ family two-component response regulator